MRLMKAAVQSLLFLGQSANVQVGQGSLVNVGRYRCEPRCDPQLAAAHGSHIIKLPLTHVGHAYPHLLRHLGCVFTQNG